ncbi:MAG: hypothetical protein LIP08_02235 [Bacteroides sp.]|nr:hypothetical protein [Bacteroides sp.]
MAQVAADIEELYLFSRNLRDMAQELSDNYAQLRNQMIRVDDTWRDQDNREFMEDFMRQADLIFRIAEHMEEYGQFIHKKADALQLYRDTRM